MKTLTTAATNSIGKQQRLTIVLDLGDRSSHYWDQPLGDWLHSHRSLNG